MLPRPRNHCGWKISESKHNNRISLKAYCSLHLICRSISPSAPIYIKTHLYIMLVRSQLTYCSQLWQPRLIKDIKCLKRVHRRDTKFVLQDHSSDYKTRLISLKLLPLMYRLELQSLVRATAMPHQMLHRPTWQLLHSKFCVLCSSQHQVHNKKQTVDQFQQNFTLTTVLLQQGSQIVELTASFRSIFIIQYIKTPLKTTFLEHFTVHFNLTNLCSLYIVCPCRNCVNTNQSVSL